MIPAAFAYARPTTVDEALQAIASGGEDVGVRRHRADDDGVPVFPDPAQLGHPGQVDDRLRGGQPQPHDRDQ